jgi:hypothetical protein
VRYSQLFKVGSVGELCFIPPAILIGIFLLKTAFNSFYYSSSRYDWLKMTMSQCIIECFKSFSRQPYFQ